MAEWSKAPVLKTGVRLTPYREFESRSLRQSPSQGPLGAHPARFCPSACRTLADLGGRVQTHVQGAWEGTWVGCRRLTTAVNASERCMGASSRVPGFASLPYSTGMASHAQRSVGARRKRLSATAASPPNCEHLHECCEGRVRLPKLMLAEDVAKVLGRKSTSAARRAIRRGDCGAYSRSGRRLIVRREEFLRARRANEVLPAPVVRSLPITKPPEWAQRVLKERKRRLGR